MNDKRITQSPINGKRGGRPKNQQTLCAQESRDRLSQRVLKKADAYFEVWEKEALGDFVEVKINGDMTRVYRKSPNPKAIKTMLQQVWGKPRQLADIEGEDDPIFSIKDLTSIGKYVAADDEEYRKLVDAAIARESANHPSVIDLSRYEVHKSIC